MPPPPGAPGASGAAPYGAPPTPGYGTPPPADYPGAPAPGYGAAPGPYGVVDYGVDPVSGLPYSDKQKLTAGLLQLLLSLVGIPGVGRLYMGRNDLGLIQLIGALVSLPLMCVLVGFFTYPAFVVWGIVDGILILTGSQHRDGQGRVLRP